MAKKFRKKITSVEEVTEETFDEEVIENITEDLEAERESQYLTNQSFLEKEESSGIGFIKGNMGMNQQSTKLLEMEGDTEKMFPCNVCDKVMKSVMGLKYHNKTHTGENPYTCRQCNYSCKTTNHLKIHMNAHTGEKCYKCQVCSKSFTDPSSLRRHILTHTEKKRYNCQLCSKSYTDSSSLRRHMMTHMMTQICTYSCSQAGNLRSHMLVHTGDYSHKCHICTLAFKHQTSLKTHVYKVHVRIPEQIKTPNKKPVKEEQVTEVNPVISSSGPGGQSRVETVFSCPLNMCSFTITKVRRLLLHVHNPTPAPYFCSTPLLHTSTQSWKKREK